MHWCICLLRVTFALQVVIVGGELGTSSYSIMPVGWLAQRVSTWKVIRHWMIAYGGNLLG